MTLVLGGAADPYLAAALAAFAAARDGTDGPRGGGAGPRDRDPLAALGWWDLLADLADPDSRAAALALFRAQGRQLASSVALGALVAQPYAAAAGLPPEALVAVISRRAAGGGQRWLVVGDVTGRTLLVDRPGHGAAVFAAADVDLRPVDVPGRLLLHEVVWAGSGGADGTGDTGGTGGAGDTGGTEGASGAGATDDADDAAGTGGEPLLDERAAAPARARGLFLGRIAAALEILGAAEETLATAVSYAAAREQFGRPIGANQAVRHLLAWALTDCAALESVAEAAIRLDDAAPPRHDEVVKALAGRNGRRVCERTLQVMGGVGFTTEHDHHHFHSRVLALDAVLGTSTDLTNLLGAWMRETQAEPATAAAVLVPGPAS